MLKKWTTPPAGLVDAEATKKSRKPTTKMF